MKISFGNAIYNHKPTNNDMVWHSGFLNAKKEPIECPVREDTAENYAFAYDNGLCVKGYKFCSNRDIWKRTFICDFDNLTEEQYHKVIELVGTGSLRRIQGRMSSGMKVDCFKHEGIPDWKPAKWKYKVFFPLDEFYNSNGVMCVREEVEKAYLDVVQFFNPWSERKRTEEVARLWLKANNQSMFYKHGKKKGQLRNNHPALVVEDPIFKEYILPDPVEVTNPRHQITYSVIPEMKEDYKYLTDDDWKGIFKMEIARFPATTKAHFTDSVDLPYDFKDSMEKQVTRAAKALPHRSSQQLGHTVKRVLNALTSAVQEPSIPTSKSAMARKSGKGKWSDLVFDFTLAAKTNRAIYSDWEHGYEMDKVKETMKDISKFLVRCQAEYELGVNGNPTRDSVTDNVIHDIPWYSSHVFGETFIAGMDNANRKTLASSIAKAIEKSCDLFKVWRLEQKCLKLMDENPELKKQWRTARTRLGETADFEEYYKTKNQLESKVLTKARNTNFPYAYVRRGLKKEMVEQALKSGHPMTREMFVGFVLEKVSSSDGVVEREKVESWYRDYQSRFNKAQNMTFPDNGIYGQMTGYQLKNGKVKKQHKQHKSKWDDVFSGKTKDEVEGIITALEISDQMKYKLRRRYGN